MKIILNNYKINLHNEALSILDHFTQNDSKAPEAGGIILGNIIEDEINIFKLSVPTQLDKANRTNFERHRLSAQIIINYEFYNSNKKIIYLGEWHTHPENIPTPSPVDKKMIREQFTKNKINTNFLVLLIKGLKGLYVEIIDNAGVYNIQINLI